MNYRHIYHAGNLCDVAKHAALALTLDHLRAKETPFGVIDTHAGIGLYDLGDERAGKTGEAQDGILKLLDAARAPELTTYYAALKKLNPGWDEKSAEGFRYYPGSPLLALQLFRPGDRLVGCELHEEDAAELKRQLFPYKQAQAHHRDGYAALAALLPLPEKRGLVLIDPPFEDTDEFTKLVEAIKTAQARWPQGIVMAWYPVKDRKTIAWFHERLAMSGLTKILAAEFVYREPGEAETLDGSGLIFINPPWKLDEKLRAVFTALHGALGAGFQGDRIEWLVGE